jgi:hypothetical protein
MMRANRPDRPYIERILRTSYSAGAVVLALLIANVLLVGLLYTQLRSPRLIAVIDEQSGKTYATMSQTMNEDLLKRQLVYYSRQFMEDYFTMDYSEIQGARKRSLDLMHPNLKQKTVEKYGEDFRNDGNVQMALSNQTGTEWEWSIKPTVTKSNDPVYTVFGQVKRKITREGYKPIIEQLNIRLRWGRLSGGQEAFTRPHQLVLLDQEDISKDQTALNEQINLSYK